MPGVQHPSRQGQHPNFRMLAQMRRNARESEENKGAAFGRAPPGRGAPRRLFSLLFLAFLQFWAVILSWMMMMAGD